MVLWGVDFDIQVFGIVFGYCEYVQYGFLYFCVIVYVVFGKKNFNFYFGNFWVKICFVK